MFFLILAAALLPAGLSAPVTDCDALTRRVQIGGRDQFLGVWTYAAESTDMPGSKLITKMFVDNVWVKVYPAKDSDSFFVFQVQKMFGRCYSLTSKLTLVNDTLRMEGPVSATEVLVTTSCPDCILLLSNYTFAGNVYRGMQLLTRRAKVESGEMDEFKRQAECLGLPSPTILDADKGFCSDGSTSTDLTSTLSQADPEYTKLLDELLSSQNGVKTLLELLGVPNGAADLSEGSIPHQ